MYVISLLGMSKVIQAPMYKIGEWLDSFKGYIPTKIVDQITYFEIEAVEVLTFIKEKNRRRVRSNGNQAVIKKIRALYNVKPSSMKRFNLSSWKKVILYKIKKRKDKY